MISKKGVMSIETMIIFIAVVLIAAVASGALLRSSNLLQQRALMVSDEARERFITGIEMMNVLAESQLINETLNNFEILVRLKPGSNPVQAKDLGLMLITSEYSTSATLEHPEMENLYDDIDISAVTNTSWLNIPNIEVNNRLDVGVTSERVRLLVNGSGDNEVLLFDLSYASNNPDQELLDLGINVPGEIFEVNLGVDISNVTGPGIDIEIYDLPIKHSVTQDIFGFVTIIGTVTINDSLVGVDAVLSSNPKYNYCDFNRLTPNTKFCMITQIGEDDTRMERGELFLIKYKVKEPLAIGTEEQINMRLIPKGGAIEEISTITPMVFVLQKTSLWG